MPLRAPGLRATFAGRAARVNRRMVLVGERDRPRYTLVMSARPNSIDTRRAPIYCIAP